MIDIEVNVHLLAQRLTELGATDLRPLPGGASSLSYIGTARGMRVVVKVAPAGLEPVRNRDVLRQARLLRRAIGPTDVPVPEVLFEDAGDPPDVPPLFVMSFVAGTSLEPLFDDSSDRGDDEASVVAARMRDAARILARLHSLDPAGLGIADDPVPLADEVDRWATALRTVDEALAPGWPDVSLALLASVPDPWPATIVHGDFRLGNLLATGPTVTAVIDWEIWSVGDPRVDLGWFLANADPATYPRATPYAGRLPYPSELTDLYAGQLGRVVPDLGWFRALACYKSTATWSLIVKHARRRRPADPALEAMAERLPALLAAAQSFLE